MSKTGFDLLDETIQAIRARKLPASAALEAAAKSALARIAQRPEPDLREWAERLAADVAEADD